MDAVKLDAIERELAALLGDGSEGAAQRADELVAYLEAAVGEDRQANSELAQGKLRALVEEHPWMEPERVGLDIGRIVGENASAKSKRRKVIAIANRMTEALAPYVACRPGCGECCRMNTIIYEHEAIRLAEVSGRTMTRLPFRPRDVVFADGMRFNGRPCPFLVENRCSVYEARPLVCRTHHSLRDDASQCSMDIPASQQVRPPMYQPDLLEVPYMELNAAYNLLEPVGNIAEFFPD